VEHPWAVRRSEAWTCHGIFRGRPGRSGLSAGGVEQRHRDGQGCARSITNFEGIGDVAITYENEVLVGRQSDNYELVPQVNHRIDNPVAVVDTYVDKHGTREVAEAFVDFLFTREAQETFAKYGLRSPDEEVAKAPADMYPPIEDLFTIDEFGGWSEATPTFFGEDGIFYHVFGEAQGIQVSE
jgi:sulfate transport system substrate-binding protein